MPLRTTVVIPCYNVDAYLGESLGCLRRQTAPPLEIVLVDDGSRVPVRIPEGWDGPPIRLIRKENGGLPRARNTGIAAAKGEFVAFLDADDFCDPRRIEAQERALDGRPDAVACYTRCVDRPGFFRFGPYPPQDVGMDEFLAVHWYGQFFPPSSEMIRRSVLEKHGGFDERLRIGEDLELTCRLLRYGAFVQVPEALTWYRRHPQQLTNDLFFRIVANAEARRIVVRRDADLLVRAGIPADQLWDAYRNELFLAYYRRRFDVVRRLLWHWWGGHPGDLQAFKYAVISLFPSFLVDGLRGGLAPGAPDGAKGDADRSGPTWASAVEDVRRRFRLRGATH